MHEYIGNEPDNPNNHAAEIRHKLQVYRRQPQGVSVYYEIADPMIFDLCELVCDRISNQMQQRAKEFEQFTAFTSSSK
ncbi:MAG: hypothetical protein MUD14_11325 [Hydrococcus sp. Prado102]|nr:hypothetical protein [Hydrococcus sp. Prado102]